jgi:hypothetical protein
MIFYGKQDTWFEKQSFFSSASKFTKHKQQTELDVLKSSLRNIDELFYTALGKGGRFKINPD